MPRAVGGPGTNRPHHAFSRIALCGAAALIVGLTAGRPVGAQEPGQESSQENHERSVRRLGDVVSAPDEEFSMGIPEVAPAPAADRPDVSVPNADRNVRLQALLDRRAFASDSSDVDAALGALMVEIRDAALADLSAGDLDSARARDAALRELAPDLSIGDRIEAAGASRERIDTLGRQLEQALEQGRLLQPSGNSAVDHLASLRRISPQTASTIDERVAEALRSRFDELLAAQQLDEAASWIDAVTAAALEIIDSTSWRSRLRVAAETRIENLQTAFRQHLRQQELSAASDALNAMIAAGAENSIVMPLRSELDRLRRYGGFEPGQRFSDPIAGAGRGPEMVVVPAGSARLGSPPGEPGRFDDERPAFSVNFDRGFALSETEITVAQFREFIRASGHRTDAERAGRSNAFDRRVGGITEQRFVDWTRDYLGNPAADNLPVVHVSFNDARAYVDWLAEQTGQPYRLPSEAEFEYALRAGTESRFWWGNEAPDPAAENLAGDGDRLGRDQRWSDAFDGYRDGFWGPAPVSSFRANPFGLYDMGGNVLEWTMDCWVAGYEDPPVDGRARTSDGCSRRVLRGGAWTNGPTTSRSAYRLAGPPDFHGARVGFRVARLLIEADSR